MSNYRCPLGNLQPSEMDVEQVKRDGWRDHGILVVAIDDKRLDMIDREFVRRLGLRLYGKRGEKTA